MCLSLGKARGSIAVAWLLLACGSPHPGDPQSSATATSVSRFAPPATVSACAPDRLSVLEVPVADCFAIQEVATEVGEGRVEFGGSVCLLSLERGARGCQIALERRDVELIDQLPSDAIAIVFERHPNRTAQRLT